MIKKIIALSMLFSLIAMSAFAKQRYAEKVSWHSLEDGMNKAKKEKKPLLIDFAVPHGCPRCDFLQRNVYNRDEIVQKINSDFVPVLIDLSADLSHEEKELGERYDYKNDCLLLFLDYKGNVIKRPGGGIMCFPENVDPEVFIQYLEEVKKTMKKDSGGK